MAKSPEAIVEPTLLVWARESAGMSVEDAAKKLNAKRAGAYAEKVRQWEDPDVPARPSVSQLRRLAAAYKRPLAVFYLDEPPLDFQPVRDYRRLGDRSAADDVSLALRVELSRVIDMQEMAAALLAEDPDEEIHPEFPVRGNARSNPEELAARLRQALRTTIARQEQWTDSFTALREWRSAAESLGVLVTQASGVSINEMRGFALDHARLPLICLNATDEANGRIFTLMHELAHVALRQGGLCEWHAGRQSPRNERIETFCNHVAGAILVPEAELLASPIVADGKTGPRTWSNDEIQQIARRFSVSRHVILRRLLICGRVSRSFYQSKERELLKEYRDWASRERPSFPVAYEKRVANSVGRGFIRLVLGSYYEQRLTLADASSLIGVRVRHLPAIEHEVMGWSHIRTADA